MLLEPLLLEKVWGGDRLSRFPTKRIEPGSRIGESWEASGLAGQDSKVASGPWTGMGLSELVRKMGADLTGTASSGEFPLLLKLIDARERLSLQLHPPDRAAYQTGAPPGKAEAWYVLEGGEIVLGLAPGVDPAELPRILASGGDPSPLLNHLEVRPGDVVPVPPGTLHAIGAGLLVVEVQQPADTTYRVHDWGRTGRELHLASAMAVLDPLGGAGAARFRSDTAPLDCRRGRNSFQFLTGCRHFGLELAQLQEHAPWLRAPGTLELLHCLKGRYSLATGPGEEPLLSSGPGQTVLLPATMPDVWIEPMEPVTLLIAYPCRLEREIYDRMLTWGHAGAAVAERLFPG